MQAKGLPNWVLATVAWVVVVAVVLPRGRRSGFDRLYPECQYIDSGKTHRWRSRRAKAAGDDVRPAHAVGPSQQAPLLRWLEARHLRGQASNGLHHDADPSRIMAGQLAVSNTLA